MSDFLVDDELSPQIKSPAKARKKPKNKNRRVVASPDSSSESDRASNEQSSKNAHAGEESSSYDRNLQLFYIRFNNLKEQETSKYDN